LLYKPVDHAADDHRFVEQNRAPCNRENFWEGRLRGRPGSPARVTALHSPPASGDNVRKWMHLDPRLFSRPFKSAASSTKEQPMPSAAVSRTYV
jgi:hypothetical protein